MICHQMDVAHKKMETFAFSAEPKTTLPPPGEPPDFGGIPSTTPNIPPVSFRDKVMGNIQATPMREKVDLIEKKLVSITYEQGNRLLPKVHLDESVFNELCAPWKDSLVVKLLGKSIGYNMMKEKLKQVWKPAGGFDILDVDNGFYMVKFDMEADREKALSDGPWMVYDHYLAVSRWTPEFVSPEAKVDRTTVWIRFPGLNLVYYDESFLLALASAVGKPIKVDRNTLKVERGRFARICVEIDLNQPVVGKVCLNDHWYKVSYEGLHIICSNCGCYGHLGRNCKAPPPEIQPKLPVPPKETEARLGNTGPEVEAKTQEATVTETPMKQDVGEVHGEWLVVSRRKRSTFPQKEPFKNNLGAHTSNNFEKLSTPSKEVGHVGVKGKGLAFNVSDFIPKFTPSVDNKAPKRGWQIKKRRHDEGTSNHSATATPTKAKLTGKTHPPLKKDVRGGVKEQVSSLQTGQPSCKPLQESSKQNMIPSPAGNIATMKGFRSAMHIEQVGHNHFKFSEENKPPDTLVVSMELTEDSKEKDNSSSEVLMQEDSDMGVDTKISDGSPN